MTNYQIKLLNPEFFFYHIEKCAGSSIRKILLNYFTKFIDINEIYYPDNYNNINLLNDIDYIKLINLYGESFFKNKRIIMCHTNFIPSEYFSLTIIRNPIDRIISHYYAFDYDNYKLKLHELNKKDYETYIIQYGNLIVNRISGGDNSDKAYQKAINNIKNISYIMISENLDEEIIELNNILNKKFNVNYKMDILHENKNNSKIIFKEDIELIMKYKEQLKDIDFYNFVVSFKKNKL